MKNSPHHHKHLRKKALRKNSKLPHHENTHPHAPNLKVFESMRRKIEHLEPFNQTKALEIFHVFKKHLERDRHFNSNHVSKRTTPGEVEGDSPFTVMKHDTKHHHQDWKGPCLQKSNDVAHKMLRYNHSHKKAA